ncbi:uncharacterized protein J7T54_006665 [Emericellopsis cladophorae]|uniref:DUF7732 domain-containing protein n=1 Tax=Emericellopsis cladophorae TaxID=2686198 RepID=A0A9P9Y7X7_9HYPO|nr:uncharacterized protein J7T54_006665 [Emericellopsis cladophorae]KAI6784620.1 hypothetical protein J7T54_006665 [Emericellopsis cladophorae]
MRFDVAFIGSLLLNTVAANAVADLQQSHHQPRHIVRVDGEAAPRAVLPDVESDDSSDLWKRRGGGGGGGRGGGGGSRGGSGSSRGSGSGSSRGGSFPGSGGGGRSGSTRGSSRTGSSGTRGQGTNTQRTSNAGGYSRLGSGPQPRFGGGRYYGGGSTVPYSSGARTPSGLGSRGPLRGSALAFLPAAALLPLGVGLWMYGPYNYHHRYYNSTSEQDEEREIICHCEERMVCMCDDIDDEEFWDDLIGDGDYDKLNKTLVDVRDVNGTTTITVNGTLPNGTTVPGDEDEYEEYLTNTGINLGRSIGMLPAAVAVFGFALFA